MRGLLGVLTRRVTLTLRTPQGALVFCIGILCAYYVLQPVLHIVHEEVRTFILDRQEGEEYYIEDEDYIMDKILQKKDRVVHDLVDEVPGIDEGETMTRNAKSLDQPFWQEVTETNDEMYVYSAYYDDNFRLIRVIAVANKHKSQNLECRFGNDAAAVIGTSKADIKIIRETRSYTYSAAFILCPFPSEIIKSNEELPKYVSIASIRMSDVSPTSNILEIQYPSTSTNLPTKFSVCVQPTYDYDDSVKFVEWIEFHRSLGVERFTLYNISIGPRVSCIIENYNTPNGFAQDEAEAEAEIYIEVLPWGDPSDKIVSKVTIKDQNQLASLNDCIYRQRRFSQYVFNIDLDEFIIPQKGSNYEDLIKRLDLLSGRRRIGLYEFRNAFFSPTYSNPSTDDVIKIDEESESINNDNRVEDRSAEEAPSHTPDTPSIINLESFKTKVMSELMTLQHTVRMAEPHPTDARTKYICNPLKLVEAGIHHTWEMLQGFGTLNVPIKIGLLNHYRHFHDDMPLVEDLTAKNLSLKCDLFNKVFNTLTSFHEICNVS